LPNSARGILSTVGRLTVDALRAILSVSTYEQQRQGWGPTPAQQDTIRENLGGNISPLPQTKTRWYLKELELAQYNADSGDLEMAAMLYRAMRRDGVFSGLLSQCTDGLVRLPKRFFGDVDQVKELEARNGSQSVFDAMFPPQELALLAADGIMLGIGVAELLPVQGRDYPVLCRLDPQWLRYRWNENRWYYMSVTGPLPITPGDGRWLLHVPGGRISPWNSGKWQACGRAWIHKEHALSYRSNWEAKLANPARVGEVPQGADDNQQQSWFQKIAAWGVDTVFTAKPGYTVKLLESNGRGYESFQQTIETSDNEFMICLAGQIMTTTGGTGFANMDVPKSIRADIIKSVADSLSYTVNTQGLPVWAYLHYGPDSLETRAIVEWDVTPAKDRLVEANSLVTVAAAITNVRKALGLYDRELDIDQLCEQFGVPVLGLAATGLPDEVVETTTTEVVSSSKFELAPTDVAKVVTVNEARQYLGLKPLEDSEKGDKTIGELGSADAPDSPESPESPVDATSEAA
jgi:hypothetical protein